MRVWTIVVAIALAAVPTAGSQTHLASVRGTVTDPTGASVAAASLAVVHEPTGVSRPATTGDDGTFVLTQLPPGDYRIEATHSGYKTHVSRATLQP